MFSRFSFDHEQGSLHVNNWKRLRPACSDSSMNDELSLRPYAPD